MRPTQAQAQSAIGLYEGMMGNSGVAFKDSSAPSYYNPSLLSERKKDSYSLSANSFGAYSSKSEGQEATSLALNPNYLGSVIVGNHLVHEIFFTSVMPSKIKYVTNAATATQLTKAENQTDNTQMTFGYSMAFRSVPFALSYYADFFQLKSFGFSEITNANGTPKATEQTRSEQTSIGLGLSASGHFSIEQYTMGFIFKTRRLSLYNKSEGTGARYAYGSPGPTDYTKTDFPYGGSTAPLSGHALSVGHSFKNGDHEFLTDSNLVEQSDLAYRFKLIQTFGYRMNSDSGHQFLCGVNHLIGTEVKYIGQSAYYSVGYSWLTRSLRSAIGAYYYTSRLDQDISALGLTFGSEFSY